MEVLEIGAKRYAVKDQQVTRQDDAKVRYIAVEYDSAGLNDCPGLIFVMLCTKTRWLCSSVSLLLLSQGI